MYFPVYSFVHERPSGWKAHIHQPAHLRSHSLNLSFPPPPPHFIMLVRLCFCNLHWSVRPQMAGAISLSLCFQHLPRSVAPALYRFIEEINERAIERAPQTHAILLSGLSSHSLRVECCICCAYVCCVSDSTPL